MALPPDQDPMQRAKREEQNAKNLKKIKEALTDRKSVRSPKARAERREEAKQQKSILGTFFGSIGGSTVGGAVGAISDIVGSIPLVSQVADTVASATKDAVKQAKENKQIRKDERKKAEEDRKQAEQDRQQEIRDDEEAAELRKQAIKDELEAKLKAERDAGQITPGSLGVIGKDPNEENITENASNEREEMINLLEAILSNTRKDPDQKLIDKERKNELKKKKKDAPVLKKGTKEGGGLLGALGSIIGPLLSGGLGGLLAAGLGSLAGLASAIGAVVIPVLAVGAVAAAALVLGKFLYGRLGIDEAMTKGSREGTLGMTKRITKQNQIKTADDKKIFRNEMTSDMHTERFSPGAKAKMEKQGLSEDQAAHLARNEFSQIPMTAGGIPLDHDPSSPEFKQMMSGNLTAEQFITAERKARRKKGTGPSRTFLMKYQEILNADQNMRDQWDRKSAVYNEGGMFESDMSFLGVTKGGWSQFVAGIVQTNKTARNGVLQAEQSGMITEQEANMLLSMSPFIGRDWEPTHNEVLTPYTVDDEYNMPGFFNDLNLGEFLKEDYAHHKPQDSAAAKFATKGMGSFRRGGVGNFGRGTPAMLHGTEAIIPLSKVSSGGGLRNVDPVSRALLMTIAANASGSTEMQAIMGNIQNRQMQARNTTGSGSGTALLNNAPTTISNTSNTTNNISSKGPTKMTESSFVMTQNDNQRSEMFG